MRRKRGYIMSEITITKENFEGEVLKSDKPVLVDFWATWCGPCQMLAPELEAFAEKHPEIKVGKVNVDEQGELAASFNVMSIPTLLFFKDGEIVDQQVGVSDRDALEAKFAK